MYVWCVLKYVYVSLNWSLNGLSGKSLSVCVDVHVMEAWKCLFVNECVHFLTIPWNKKIYAHTCSCISTMSILPYRKSCIKAAACVQFSDLFGRLIFKTGLYLRQAYVQCCILDHHKITYCKQICTQRPVSPTHLLCMAYSRGLYSRTACVQDSQPKERLLFKTGLHSRAAFIQDFTVGTWGTCTAQ